MQQAFLHGRGWPVDNLWLYGEPVDYHILLRLLSGLTAWLVRGATGDGMAGGIVYLLVDSFYLALAPTAFLAFVVIIVPRLYPSLDHRRIPIVAGIVALLCFFTPNAVALYNGALFALTKTGSNDFWWMQHAVVPGTVSYFPFGLLLSGESHSYAQAPFLSISWLGLVLCYVLDPKNILRTTMLGMLCAMIAASHPATAMVCAAVSLPILLWDSIAPFIRRQPRAWVNTAHSVLLGTVAALCTLPSLWEHIPPQMRWVWVTDALASRLGPFTAVHLLSTLMLGAAGLLSGRALWGNPSITILSRRTIILTVLCVLLALVFINRPVIALAVGSSGISLLMWGRTRPIALLTLLGGFLVWVFPEVLVTDWVHDNRTDWIRFNTAMRFWLEALYLMPFAILTIVTPEIYSALKERRMRLVLASGTALFSSYIALSLYALTVARIERAPEKSSIDGFAFLRAETPLDYQIISYLNQLPTHVVVGEACGDGSLPTLPYHYGWPGRISAFSGRPSLCGWARHTWMFQQRLRRANLANETIWQSFLSAGEHIKTLLTNTGATPEDRQVVQRALTYLQQRGVTHIVVGELEKRAYPLADPVSVARAVSGRVMFSPAPGYGLVELAKSSTPFEMPPSAVKGKT
jgi:uncharacterized membrane protein